MDIVLALICGVNVGFVLGVAWMSAHIHETPSQPKRPQSDSSGFDLDGKPMTGLFISNMSSTDLE